MNHPGESVPDDAGLTVRHRPELPEDEAFLREVFAGTRENELAMLAGNAAMRQVFLNLQYQAMRRGYAAQFPAAEFSVILLGDQRVGRQVVDRSANGWRLVDIALLPDFRHRGIGTRCLQDLLAEAAKAGQSVRLQVFQGSPARRLYERMGFAKTGDSGPGVEMAWRPGTTEGGKPSGKEADFSGATQSSCENA